MKSTELSMLVEHVTDALTQKPGVETALVVAITTEGEFTVSFVGPNASTADVIEVLTDVLKPKPAKSEAS